MKKNTILRAIFYVAGLLILALGIILNTKSGLGVSPIISVAYSIATISGSNFGNTTFLLYSVFVVIEIILHFFRNRRYSGEADGAIAPAAHREPCIYTFHEPFFRNAPCSPEYGVQASGSCSRNHTHRNRCCHVPEHAYHPQPRRRNRTGDLRLHRKTRWIHQELF